MCAYNYRIMYQPNKCAYKINIMYAQYNISVVWATVITLRPLSTNNCNDVIYFRFRWAYKTGIGNRQCIYKR